MHYELAKVFSGRWAIAKHLLQAMIAQAAVATPDAIQAAIVAYGQRPMTPTMLGDVAVINACGPITYKSTWVSMFFGGTSIEDLQTQFRLALTDPAVRTIVFKWDSPGGSVDMVAEFADELFAARGQKSGGIVSVADLTIASAAYWLASQTEKIYATRSSELGSIGAFCGHEDIAGMLEQAGIKITLIAHGEHKLDGNPYEPLSEAARADMQKSVDAVGNEFDMAVARGRGVTKQVVLDSFGQGLMFRGKEAITLGLADKQGTFGQVVGRLTKGRISADAIIDEIHAHVGMGVVAAAKPSCEDCAPECPCEECPPECSSCAKDCACKVAKAAKAETTAPAVEADAAAIEAEHLNIAAILRS